jgi:putative FmdB family regulatory protein
MNPSYHDILVNMPTYEYICNNQHIYEETRKVTEELSKDKCPECDLPLRQLFSPPGINFKGHGFYRNSR